MFKKVIIASLVFMVLLKAEIVSALLLTAIGVIAIYKLFEAIVEHGNW